MSERTQQRPPGRRSAIVLLIGAGALLVWALTAGDEPRMRVASVGAVISMIVTAIVLRGVYRTIRRSKHAAAAVSVIAPERVELALPEPYQELVHQLDAAARSASYLASVLSPRIEALLDGKHDRAGAQRVAARMARLNGSAGRNGDQPVATPWIVERLTRSPRTVAKELHAVIEQLAELQ